ncbi:hypothetical protein [Micromonospora sp. CPCC 205561]|uniref:hypothetical protein n=1 Tax=Micromonospora sp. CPCC 205561 TaxID=3122407 RepID=UPI002FF1CE6B
MIRALATATTAFAGLAGLAVLLGTGSWRSAMRVLLDLLTAAGLLRLAHAGDWADLAAAAAIVLLRRLLWSALTAGPPGPTPAGPPGPAPAGPNGRPEPDRLPGRGAGQPSPRW